MVATAAMPLPTMVDTMLLLTPRDMVTAPMLLPPTLLTLTAPTATLHTDILAAAGILMLLAPAPTPLATVLMLPLPTALMPPLPIAPTPLATVPMPLAIALTPLAIRPTGTGMFSTLPAPPSCTVALPPTDPRELDTPPTDM